MEALDPQCAPIVDIRPSTVKSIPRLCDRRLGFLSSPRQQATSRAPRIRPSAFTATLRQPDASCHSPLAGVLELPVAVRSSPRLRRHPCASFQPMQFGIERCELHLQRVVRGPLKVPADQVFRVIYRHACCRSCQPSSWRKLIEQDTPSFSESQVPVGRNGLAWVAKLDHLPGSLAGRASQISIPVVVVPRLLRNRRSVD